MPAFLLSAAVRHLGRALLGLVLGTVVSCKEKPAPPPPPSAVSSSLVEDDDGIVQESSAKAGAPKAPPAPQRCREVRAGALFSIGENSPRTDSAPRPDDGDGDDDEAIAMPFEAELGAVIGYRGGFALGVLESKKGGQAVNVALLGSDGSGRVLPVATVHGDVEPPEVVTLGERLLVVYGDSDASGATLQSALFPPGADKPQPGPELTNLQRDAGVAVAASGSEALVTFGRTEKGKAGLYAARLKSGDKLAFSTPELVQGTSDAESPHLVVRPGGYWLSWIEQRSLPTKARANKDAGDDDESAGLELGPRLLHIVPLDAAGHTTSAPLALTKEPSHVVAFELAPWPDGGAVLAYREDAAAPGVEGGDLHLVHVRSDGSVEQGELADAEIGAGVPSLLSDPAPRSPGSVVWLAAGGANETTRFGLLTGSGTALTELVSDKLLGTAELVGVYGGKLLAARPRRTARDLFLLECTAAGR